MTHEEEEEMLHDISKLQDQVQQRSLSQKLLEAKIKGVETKMDDLKIDLKTNMEDLKTGMEDLKTNLTKFLQ